MFRKSKSVYKIKSVPSDDVKDLEDLLNKMSREGWDLYSLQESENDEGYCYNCIFLKDAEPEEENDDFDDVDDNFGYRNKMQRLMAFDEDQFTKCKDIQIKIKDKRQQISKAKSVLDSVSEDMRSDINTQISKYLEELKQLKLELKANLSPENATSLLKEDKLKIKLSEENIDLINPDLTDNLIAYTVKARQELADSLGFVMPKIKFESDEALDENIVSFSVRGIEALSVHIYNGYKMFYTEALNLEEYPKGSIEDIDNITEMPVVWILEENCKDYWEKGLMPCEVIMMYLKHICIKYVDEILDYNDINRYIDVVSDENMFLVENIIPEFISVSELKYIICNLLKEKVSVKDIVYIFEKINDLSDENTKDDIVDKLRIMLARQISASVADENNTIKAYELSEESLKEIEGILNSINEEQKETVVKVDADFVNKIIDKLDNLPVQNEYVIVVPFEIRSFLSAILHQFFENLIIISSEEIAPEFIFNSLGEI